MGQKLIDIPNGLLAALAVFTFFILGATSRLPASSMSEIDLALDTAVGKSKLLKTIGKYFVLLFVYVILLSSFSSAIEKNEILFGIILCAWGLLQIFLNIFIFRFGFIGTGLTLLWIGTALAFIIYSYVSTKHIAMSLFWSCGLILLSVTMVSRLAFSLLRK